MRPNLVPVLVLCANLGGCGGAAALEDGVVEECRACHRETLSLADREPAALAERIAALAEDAAAHPVPLPALSEAELAELADALTTE